MFQYMSEHNIVERPVWAEYFEQIIVDLCRGELVPDLFGKNRRPLHDVQIIGKQNGSKWQIWLCIAA